jgi:hypothetical protein
MYDTDTWRIDDHRDTAGLGTESVMSAHSVDAKDALQLLPGLSDRAIEKALMPVPARRGKNFKQDSAILSRGTHHHPSVSLSSSLVCPS